MSETILTAENLKFRYDSEQPGYALNGVSVQVRRGEFVAVLGANGCGKSTLAKHFNAILLPEEGKVYVEGMDAAEDDKLYDIRQTVGMVFQSPDNQIVATPQPLGRPEAARRHCGRRRHASRLPHPRRGHRHARPSRP